jgi:hypothetical protein
MNTDTSTAHLNGAHPPARPVMPPQELFEREPEGIGPLSEELKASLADAQWIDDEIHAGRLREYAGTNIAVIDRQVVGTGDSQLGLIYDTAERLGVLPCRVAVCYIG